jgi:hypothetical protein
MSAAYWRHAIARMGLPLNPRTVGILALKGYYTLTLQLAILQSLRVPRVSAPRPDYSPMQQ